MKNSTKCLLLFAVMMMAVQPAALAARRDSPKKVRKERPDITDGSWKGGVVLGANVTYETPWYITPYTQINGGPAKFNPSISSEFRLTRHSGLGVELGYRVAECRSWGESATPSFRTRAISIPITYKYYGRVLNFLCGFSYDRVLDIESEDPSAIKRDQIHLMVGMSKDIRLSKHMIFEPYVRWSPFSYIGVGFGVKYRL